MQVYKGDNQYIERCCLSGHFIYALRLMTVRIYDAANYPITISPETGLIMGQVAYLARR